MATHLLKNETAKNASSTPVSIRPGKSNFYPITVAITGVITAGNVKVQTSPTDETTDWVDQVTWTNATVLPAYIHIDFPWERIRVITDGNFVGNINVYAITGA